MALPKALIAWSSGKDCAWALHEIRKSGACDIVGALTTVTDTFQRVSMHGVREALLQVQLASARLPGRVVRIPFPCSNEIYEQAMRETLLAAKAEGITQVVFGDLFLEDLRAYREQRLAEIGMSAIFPLWKRATDGLAREMIASGVKAHLVCVDLAKLPVSFAGQRFDDDLLTDLPLDIDPCGENGEFHSFACAGPIFTHCIDVELGEVVERDGFAYADLMPPSLSEGCRRKSAG
jgi:uncharacterized protein (TIGR00290 family)